MEQTIQLRRAFGNFKGDDQMFGKCISSLDNKPHKLKIQYINWYSVTKLTLEHVINYGLFAVDHHCSDIIKQLTFYYPQMSENYIKELIWIYRSSLNFRESQGSKHRDYLKIQNQIDFLSKRIIITKFFVAHS